MRAARIDKGAVARNFSAAASSYDRWATAQSRIAAALVRRLPRRLTPTSIADLGCGTGMLTGMLLDRYPEASLCGIDLAEGMVAHCRARWPGVRRARFVLADAEGEASLVRGADLVASSCALQWFVDPSAAVRMWAGAMAPGGHMALAALSEGSFPELEAAHREALGSGLSGLHLSSAEELCALVRAAGLAPLAVEAERVTISHADAREALRSFRKTGALLSGIGGRAPLGLSAMRRLLAVYERQRGADGTLPMTFASTHVLAERRP